MKIQNKSARLWIGLGLLGLIMFGIKSFTGPFGGIIVEMFSDAGIIFLIVGIYLESRSKKKSDSRGFIPLIVAVMIGLVAIGGTVATIALKSKNPELAAPKVPVTGPVRDQNGPEEVINQAQGVSATNAEKGANSQKQEDKTAKESPAPVARAEIAVKTETKLEVGAEIQEICDKANNFTVEKRSADAQYLLADVKDACEDLSRAVAKSRKDIADSASQSIMEKWRLLNIASEREIARLKERETERTREEEENRKEKESYTESDTYPIILSFTDNYGNVNKESHYNGYQGEYRSYTETVLRVGDTIKATIQTKDPKGLPIYYNWNSSSQHFNDAVGRGQYSTNNTLTYTLTQEDLQSSGETFRLVWQIRTEKGYYRFGGGQYDDAGFIDYKLEP